MMDYDASITYRTPVTDERRARRAGHRGGTVPGSALPDLRADLHRRQGLLPHRHHRAHKSPTRSTCPRPAWSPTSRSSRPSSTRARPRPSRSRGSTCCSTASDVVMGYQVLIEVPNDQVRIGHAGGRGVGVERREGSGGGWTDSNLVGWIPTGEPDVDDPTLVNRIN